MVLNGPFKTFLEDGNGGEKKKTSPTYALAWACTTAGGQRWSIN